MASTDTVELTLADGMSTLALQLAPPQKPGAPRTLSDALQAAASDEAAAQQLSPTIIDDWSGGVGVDYDGAYGVYTRTKGYACPAGAGNGVTVQTGANTTNTRLVAFAEYNGDFYIAQEGASSLHGGRVIKLTGGTGTISELFALSAGDYIRDLLVADDGSGNTVLFATSESATHTNARLHKCDGSTVTHTTAGTEFSAARGLGRMAYVHWTTSDGNSDWRIVAITGAKTIAYTVPSSNPMTGTATWSPDIRIGTSGNLLEMAAFRRHVYFGATDDLYDLNELGESQGMTRYLRAMLQTGNGYAVETLNSYIYMAVGRGIIRVYVGDGHFDESPLEGQCAPGWGTPAEGTHRGYVTAMCVDQGYLVAAVYNDSTKMTQIYWGIDRRVAGVQTANPLAWYGPEVVYASDYKVSRIVTSGLAGAGDLRLWIASQSVAGGTPRLDYVSLPIAGSPIQDLSSGGSFAFMTGRGYLTGGIVQPYARLEMLADAWGDKNASKILYQHSVGSRGPLDSNTKMIFRTRSDPAPGTSGPTGTYTSSDDITASPIQSVTPTSVVQGNKTQIRIDFEAIDGVPILDSLRSLAWKIVPDVPVVSITVQYGDGVDGDDDWSPDDKTAALQDVAGIGRTTWRDPGDQRWTVKVLQVQDGGTEYFSGGTWGKRVTKHIRMAVLGTAA